MRRFWAVAPLLGGLWVVGCSTTPEIDRPGTWKPTGANEHNLRAMIADPRDLVVGETPTTDRGNGAARAVTRIYTDHRRQLLNVTVSRVAPSQDAADTPLGGGGGSGTATGGSSP